MKRFAASSRWFLWLFAWLLIGAIAGLIGWAWYNWQNRQHLRETDKKIVAETEELLLNRLKNPDEKDSISRSYGKFIRLTEIRWERPNYPWQLVERLDGSAIVHFEKARASLGLRIERGEVLSILRLEVLPTEEFRGNRTPVIMDHELWIDHTRCTIEGWATHSEFLYH